MKLMQLNLWMGRLTRRILPVIERERPDIITAQEVYSSSGSIIFPDKLYDIHERIAALGYEHVYFSPVCETVVGNQTVRFGNAIYSTIPLEGVETIFTNGSYGTDSNSPDFDPNTRNAQLVRVRLNNHQINIVNHHGYWEPDPAGSQKTVIAMGVLVDALKKLTGPIILSGDLNVNPGTPALQLFEGWLEDLTATYQIKDTLTLLGIVHNVAPDHVFVSNEIRVRSYRALDDVVSDHKVLLCDFEVS